MKTRSIVRRLVVAILLVELLSALVVSSLALAHEKHEQFRTFDVMLRGRADSLLGSVQETGDEADDVMLDGTERNLPKDDLYVVMDEKGRVLGRSPNWPEDAAKDAIRHPAERGTMRIGGALYFQTMLGDKRYRAVRMEGTRMVDPGEKGGGVARRITIVYGAPVSHVWKEVDEAVEFYTIASLSVMIVTALLMVWLLRVGLAPLRELAEEAGAVSVTSWEFAPSRRVLATRELRPLAQALTDVLGGLKDSFEQRDRFVSDAAHELKTGVAVVKSSLQLLTMRERTVPEYESGLERAKVDCERMEAIVGKMLLLARLDGAQAEAGPGRSDGGLVVREVVHALAPMAESRGVRLTLEVEDGVMVAAGPDDLRLVCANLTQNAIQHSGADDAVRVVLLRKGAEAELRVEDRGSGITPEALPHVFERFYRGDPSRSRETGGTGLGLAICKAIVGRLGGEIAIESKVGSGTMVTVRLPAAVFTVP